MDKIGYYKTKHGLITRIYNNQVRSSKARCHPLPTYTRQELEDWMYSKSIFHELYDNWKSSDFNPRLVPSCDRLDDYKSYTLDNLRIVTWDENNRRSHEDIKNGINTKPCKTVLQFTLDGELIKEHYSITSASRKLGIERRNIAKGWWILLDV